ncbi:unnamed protein product, partial [Choristocarpus tenellus]
VPARTILGGSTSTSTAIATATSLLPDSEYRFRVRASNSRGHGPFSSSSEVFHTGPSAPERSLTPPKVDVHSVTEHSMDISWGGWAGDGALYEAQYQRYGGRAWRNIKTKGASIKLSAGVPVSATDLHAYSRYRFRVRAVNTVGTGAWSQESDWFSTLPEFPGAPSVGEGWGGREHEKTRSDVFGSILLSLEGEGQHPANMLDPDYAHGAGWGGDGDGGIGGGGMAVLISRTHGLPRASRSHFYFTAGSPQAYRVPSHSSVNRITIKLWGAGGAG